MASSFHSSVTDFDLNFLDLPKKQLIPDKALRKSSVQFLKTKLLLTDSIVNKYNSNKDLLEANQKSLLSAQEECKNICIEYRNAVEKCSKLETEIQQLQNSIKTLTDKCSTWEGQNQALKSHIHQLQVLVSEYEKEIEKLKLEAKPLKDIKTHENLNEKRITRLKTENNLFISHLYVLSEVIQKKRKNNKSVKALLEKYEKLGKEKKVSTSDYDDSEDDNEEFDDVPEAMFHSEDSSEHVEKIQSLPNNLAQLTTIKTAAEIQCIKEDSKIDTDMVVVPETHLVKMDTRTNLDICGHSVDTGRGSSLAFSDGEKSYHSPEYYASDSPLCALSIDSHEMIRSLQDVCTSPILKYQSVATSPTPFGCNTLTTDRAVSPILVMASTRSPVAQGMTKKVNTFKEASVNTSPKKSILKRDILTTFEASIQCKMESEKTCLELNNSSILFNDTQNDTEIETILNKMKFTHRILTPLPPTPVKNRSRLRTPSFNGTEHTPEKTLDEKTIKKIDELCVMVQSLSDRISKTSLPDNVPDSQDIHTSLNPLLDNVKKCLIEPLDEGTGQMAVEPLTKLDLDYYDKGLKVPACNGESDVELPGAMEEIVERDNNDECLPTGNDSISVEIITEDNEFREEGTDEGSDCEDPISLLFDTEMSTKKTDEHLLKVNKISVCDGQPYEEYSKKRTVDFEKDTNDHGTNKNIPPHDNVNDIKKVRRRQLTKLEKMRHKLLPKSKIISENNTAKKLKLKPKAITRHDKSQLIVANKTAYEKAVMIMAELKRKQPTKFKAIGAKYSKSVNTISYNNIDNKLNIDTDKQIEKSNVRVKDKFFSKSDSTKKSPMSIKNIESAHTMDRSRFPSTLINSAVKLTNHNSSPVKAIESSPKKYVTNVSPLKHIADYNEENPEINEFCKQTRRTSSQKSEAFKSEIVNNVRSSPRKRQSVLEDVSNNDAPLSKRLRSSSLREDTKDNVAGECYVIIKPMAISPEKVETLQAVSRRRSTNAENSNDHDYKLNMDDISPSVFARRSSDTNKGADNISRGVSTRRSFNNRIAQDVDISRGISTRRRSNSSVTKDDGNISRGVSTRRSSNNSIGKDDGNISRGVFTRRSSNNSIANDDGNISRGVSTRRSSNNSIAKDDGNITRGVSTRRSSNNSIAKDDGNITRGVCTRRSSNNSIGKDDCNTSRGVSTRRSSNNSIGKYDSNILRGVSTRRSSNNSIGKDDGNISRGVSTRRSSNNSIVKDDSNNSRGVSTRRSSNSSIAKDDGNISRGVSTRPSSNNSIAKDDGNTTRGVSTRRSSNNSIAKDDGNISRGVSTRRGSNNSIAKDDGNITCGVSTRRSSNNSIAKDDGNITRGVSTRRSSNKSIGKDDGNISRGVSTRRSSNNNIAKDDGNISGGVSTRRISNSSVTKEDDISCGVSTRRRSNSSIAKDENISRDVSARSSYSVIKDGDNISRGVSTRWSSDKKVISEVSNCSNGIKTKANKGYAFNLLSYDDLDLYSDERNTKKSAIPKDIDVSEPPIDPKDSIICHMVEKYAVDVVYFQATKIPDATANRICTSLEEQIAKINELKFPESKHAMNDLVAELKHWNVQEFLVGLKKYMLSPDRRAELYKVVVTPPAPSMTKSEQVLLFVVTELRYSWEGFDLIQEVLNNIEYTLFSLNRTPEFNAIESMAHFYAILCRYYKMKSRLRLFVLDAMYCLQYKCMPLIKQCLDVWMHILPLGHMSLSHTPLVTCLIYLLHFYKCNDKFNRAGDIKNILKHKYAFKITEWNETRILEMLRSAIKEMKDNQMEKKMLRMALIILAKRNGAKWCQNQIINNMLLPLIDSQDTSVRAKQFCLSILGPLMKPYPNDMKVHCEIITNKLFDLLNEKPTLGIWEAIISSLIYMTKLSNRLLNYLLKCNRRNVSPEFEELLKDYVKMKSVKVWKNLLCNAY